MTYDELVQMDDELVQVQGQEQREQQILVDEVVEVRQVRKYDELDEVV
jgi:hypothetical protein